MSSDAEAAAEPRLRPDSKLVRHTRTCNKREVCSCMLRVESEYFQMNLAGKAAKAAKKRPTKSAAVVVATKAKARRFERVMNIQDLDFELKRYLVSFLSPLTLARLSLTNKTFKHDIEVLAERATTEFLAEAPLEKLLHQNKPMEKETWSRFMHNQMTCVIKMFVYYTGYKTGDMRKQYPHWAFGVVYVDPNAPHRIILPNTWSFHGHKPWVKRRQNGKDGEWLLQKKYMLDKAPKDFLMHVKEWASTLRPGSLLAIAYQNAGSLEPRWWEAQAWYVWRGDGKQDPAKVYDPVSDTRTLVHPDQLEEHFKGNPLHVIDVTTTEEGLCRRCRDQGRSFKYCHLDKGHPML